MVILGKAPDSRVESEFEGLVNLVMDLTLMSLKLY